MVALAPGFDWTDPISIGDQEYPEGILELYRLTSGWGKSLKEYAIIAVEVEKVRVTDDEEEEDPEYYYKSIDSNRFMCDVTKLELMFSENLGAPPLIERDGKSYYLALVDRHPTYY